MEMTRHWAMADAEGFFAEPDGGVLDRASDAVVASARAIAATALREACEMLAANEAALRALAEELLRVESLDGDAARRIVDAARAPARSA
jgi:hypothetical protein